MKPVSRSWSARARLPASRSSLRPKLARSRRSCFVPPRSPGTSPDFVNPVVKGNFKRNARLLARPRVKLQHLGKQSLRVEKKFLSVVRSPIVVQRLSFLQNLIFVQVLTLHPVQLLIVVESLVIDKSFKTSGVRSNKRSNSTTIAASLKVENLAKNLVLHRIVTKSLRTVTGAANRQLVFFQQRRN